MKPKLLTLIAMMLLLATAAAAHKPVIVGKDTNTTITEPEVSHAYYGKLNGEAHTYTINTEKNITLYVNILQPDPSPDSETSEARSFSVRIKQYEGDDKTATYGMEAGNWEQYYEKHGKDHYLRGPELERDVTADRYVITVSNDENQGKYALAVGKQEDFGLIDRITAWFKAIYLDWWFFG